MWLTFGTAVLTSPLFAVFHGVCVERARQALGDPCYDSTFRRGTEFTSDQAIAYALDEPVGAA